MTYSVNYHLYASSLFNCTDRLTALSIVAKAKADTSLSERENYLIRKLYNFKYQEFKQGGE